MTWKSIGNDRRGPTDLLILLRLVVVRVMRNVPLQVILAL
jgi:hypothetical protein